ncbi:MAG: putative Efflux transporter, permease protein [Candidatus Saccharibacteria bacterium]|jgi:ABC-type antimicrobial peptide transport system permease subunit|nr:putative Efflux transporter, permease protein [Candidatus Saccharibacteria bacterium]
MTSLLIFEHVQNAYYSLRSTKLRTFLTVLGVTIGVASITTILSLAGGVTKLVSSQIDDLGGNIAIIRPAVASKSLNDYTSPSTAGVFTTSTLTEKDLRDIEAIDSVAAAAPLMVLNGSLKAATSGTKPANSTIVATTPALQTIAHLTVRDGQFIDSVTDQFTTVIGSQLSIDLFGTDQSIGQTFMFRGQTFRIIGILDRIDHPINYNNIDFDHTAIISLETGKGFNQGIAQIQQINVSAQSIHELPQVMTTINKQLLANHQGEKDFTVMSGKEVAEPTSQFFKAVTAVMTAIAAISLVVGGIGIMNIMLVGVAERTREIGLRKAVGASNANIVWQFLIEALIMSLIGGVLGYIGGYLIAFIISTALPFDPIFTWQIAAIAIGVAVMVGAIFGLYPAIRAARKDPIESLRQYH